MYNFEYSEPAENDLDNALEYISFELDNHRAAVELYRNVTAAIDRLCLFPESGAKVKHDSNSIGYRFVRCKNYLLFYHIENTTVKIDRILYGRMDYITLLFGQSDIDEE